MKRLFALLLMIVGLTFGIHAIPCKEYLRSQTNA